ncbi:aminotransferase class IV [Candidatus Peregrinibacteria bacterium]|nr:aminotransferase class IV [Candidatus Peregrinibacteria bacterium]
MLKLHGVGEDVVDAELPFEKSEKREFGERRPAIPDGELVSCYRRHLVKTVDGLIADPVDSLTASTIKGLSVRIERFLTSPVALSADFTADVAKFLGYDVAELLTSGVVPVIVEKDGNPYGKPWHGKSALRERLARAQGHLLPDYREEPNGRFRLVNSPIPLCRFVEPTKPGDLVEAWDEDELGFQLDDRQAGHMTVTCFEVPKPEGKSDKPEGKWSNMATVPVAEIGTHPNNQAWHYGAALFEGIGVEYADDGEVYAFRLVDHWRRMNNGAAKIGLPPIPLARFSKAVMDTIRANRAYIPPYGKGRLYGRPNYVDYGHHLKVGNSRTALLCCTAVPIGTADAYHPITDKPIQAALARGLARAVKGGSGDVKLAGNYAGNLGLLNIIRDFRDIQHPNGFKGGLLFSDPTGTEVRESHASGEVFVQYGSDGRHKLVIPSLKDGDILDSVTSKTIIEVAADLGYAVEVRHISIDEIDQFDEALGVGTAVGVSPIHEISVIKLEHGVEIEKTVKYYEDGTTQFGRGEAGQALFDYLCAIKAGKVAKYKEQYLTRVDFDEELSLEEGA